MSVSKIIAIIQWRIQGVANPAIPRSLQSGHGKYCGQLILRKISKIVATKCQLLRLKCTKFYFRWGSAPDPAGGAYSAPRPLSCI